MKERIEEKVELTPSNYSLALRWLSLKGFKLLYPKRTVCSLYFDNRNHEIYMNTKEGIVPRKKIRIRTYNNLDFENHGFMYTLEKKLTSGEGRAKSILKNINPKPYIKEGVIDNQYGLCFPKIFINYSREYFQLDSIRVTLDKDIEYSLYSDSEKEIFNEKNYVLEIKTSINESQTFLKNFFEFPRSKFSKYERAIDSLYSIPS